MNLTFLQLQALQCLVFVLVYENNPSHAQNFHKVDSWPHRSVTDLKIYGSAIAMTKSENEQIIFLHRSDKFFSNLPRNSTITNDTVLILDRQTGKILHSWGSDLFVKPHGIEVVEVGDIFITDVMLHQVFKFSREPGSTVWTWNPNPILVLGEKFVPGSDENHFCAPADVAVDRGSGDIFVADGYCNSRIVKFDKSGRFLLQFGAGSVHPWIPVIPFNVTHSVTIAYTTTENRQESIIFVADRNNGRVQSFTENGLFLYEIGHEVFSGNEATTTMLFSIAQVEMEHSKNVITDSKSTETRNCLLYATTGNVPYGQAKVFELLIGKSIFSLLSSFSVSKADEKFHEGYQSLHDILVSDDGKDIYIVQTNNYFMLSKFTKEHLYVTSQSNVLTEPIWTLFIFAIQYHLFT